jgi:hypothetical protein
MYEGNINLIEITDGYQELEAMLTNRQESQQLKMMPE